MHSPLEVRLTRVVAANEDVERVTDALGALGFVVARCVCAEATREGIVRSFRCLIETCTPDEAAFVY